MALRFLNVELRLLAEGFNNGIRAAQREAKEFQNTIKPTKQLLSDIGSTATSAGKALSVALTAPIAAIAGVGVAFNAMQEQASIAFTTMLGDGQKAKAFLDDLKGFAATTPFEFPDLVRASQRLMAMGFEAARVRPLLTSIGDAAAALGGGAEAINRITTALGQMQAKGKVASQEMMQLTEQGIPAWEILAEKIGVDIPTAMKMVEDRAVDSARAIEALTSGISDRFGGMMEQQSKTFNGLISTIKDESRFLAGELTEGLFNALKGPVDTLARGLHVVREQISGLSDTTKATIVAVGGLAAATGPLLFIFGQLALSVTSLMDLIPKLTAAYKALTGASLAAHAAIIGATGGVVALGAALGISIGLLANWVLEATGVRNVMNGIAESAGRMAAKLMNMGTSDLLKSTVQLNEKLREHGLAVERGNKSLEQWNTEVVAAAKNSTFFKAAIQANNAVIEANGQQIRLTADAYRQATSDSDYFLTRSQGNAKGIGQVLEEIAAKNKKLQDDISATSKKAAEDLNNQRIRFQELSYQLKVAVENGKDFSRTLSGMQLPEWLRQPPDQAMPALSILGQFDWDQVNQDLTDLINNQRDLVAGAHQTAAEASKKLQLENDAAAAAFQKSWATAVGNVTSGFAKGLADAIFEAKSFKESMIKLAKETASGMFQSFVTGLLSPFTNALAGLGQGVSKSLGGLLGIGGSASKAVAGSVAGSGSSAAGGVASMAGGGLLGFAGGIAGGVISGLMGARQEGTLNAIEYNTRATEIHLRNMIDQILWPVHDRVAWIADHTQGTSGGSGGGVTLNSTYSPHFTFYGVPENMRGLMRDTVEPALMEDLEANSRGILERLVKAIRSASPGVVAGVA